MPKEQTQLDLMREVLTEDLAVLQELFQEDIMPLIKYRQNVERQIGDKEISEMYKLEAEVKEKGV